MDPELSVEAVPSAPIPPSFVSVSDTTSATAATPAVSTSTLAPNLSSSVHPTHPLSVPAFPPRDIPSGPPSDLPPDPPPLGTASPLHHSYRPPSPTSPRNAASPGHSRSQTVDIGSNTPDTSSAPSPALSSTSRPPSAKPIKRKPLSTAASVLAVRFSSASSPAIPSPLDLPKPNHRFTRPFSVDSPTLYEFSPDVRDSRLTTQSPDANLASHDAIPSGSRNIPERSPTETDFSDVLSDYGYDDLISNGDSDTAQDNTPQTVLDDTDTEKESTEKDITRQPSLDLTESIQGNKEDKDRNDHTSHTDHTNKIEEQQQQDARSTTSDHINYNPPPPMYAPKPTPPHLKLHKVDTSVASSESQPESRTGTPQSGLHNASPKLDKPLPKSPSQTSPFAALFSWAVPSPSGTEFSSIPSPASPSRNRAANDTPLSATSNSQSDGAKSNAAQGYPFDYTENYLSTPPSPNSPTAAQIEEMEDELKAISAELASSIRREMDLEDLVDRLQEQVNFPQAPGKRTSDYFSDSGYSSAKLGEFDQSRDEVEKIQRKSEQEKASLRLELTTKLQDERTIRKTLDHQIKKLHEKASEIDLAQINTLDASDRVKDLERTCEDLRRRLNEERTVKNNFEDLLAALRGELHDACNERDNLRDEVVPQLRARVEGLETEAAEYANLTYESTKIHQELESLMKENNTLRNTSRSGSATPPINRMSRAMSGGLGRSNSVATGSFRNHKPPALALSRSNSVKTHPIESREVLAEKLKDVEAQRDALHSALRNLLERQDIQNRENEKKIKILMTERERLMSASPRKAGFERDISNLRLEINVLRRRAEDALEQKWQVEKGLGGLKMDLDRAEEEIALLRALLKEKDILIPPSLARSSGSSTSSGYSGNMGTPVTSESLENAYKELQAAYTESLERVKKLEMGSGIMDEMTQLAMERLERSLSAAVYERDAARQEVDSLRSGSDGLVAAVGKSLDTERALADELSESARRVEELAAQVRHQLSTNAELRQRLADTVTRNENDHRTNSDRIAELQVRLRAMEEQLVTAQTASEDRVTRHEDEIGALREAHNDSLRRMNSSPGFGGMRSPGLMSPRKTALLSPMASPMFPRSPRLTPTKSFEDAAQMKTLRDRVSELERALEDAENEMQHVVARMSASQIEVLNLQEERETAVRETRRLQKILEQEQVKSFEDRFRSLSTNV
ncbi:hypothetical protein G7046_g1949 [Stylonectria norvegica]|nr:hypothetical protein G7046_g1949 [Stylonectria norvegica]